ncbi:MAG TPA: IclR family transcriptional regulator [Anaerolineae bacterium]|nr:IclR family transcriptional regulator [Anaerolineae bacterium]HIQ05741.1 IclR family transcriptional regulator [Anaerolineae bacterium]
MSHLAVERALILLRYIVDSPDGLSIREASRSLGYSPATVQKLINALKAQGYVVQDKLTGRYHLGVEAVQLGLAALSRLEIRRIAHPHLEALSRETGETAFLGIARDDHAIYIDKVVSTQPVRMDAPLGVNRPYNCTAVGKALLAAMPDEKLEQLAADGAFERRTERSICEVDALRAEIERVRKQGWAQDDEEYIPGVGCIAVPVRDHEGRVIAAVTVSGPASRIKEKLGRIVAQVKARAASISGEMGYRTPQT